MKITGEMIANNIRAERNRNKLSQEDVANRLTNKISLRTYNNYEIDAKNVPASILGELSEIFGCGVDAFFIVKKSTNCEQEE